MTGDKDYHIHQSSIVDPGASIGKGTKIWHFSHIMSSAIIGENCIIGQNVFIGENVVIGNGVKIQNNVSIFEGVSIENDVFIGPSVVFTNVLRPRSFINQKSKFQKTLVCHGATVGANSTILCGNTIGQFAMIGAGSVLTKSPAAYELWQGNPAKRVGQINKEGHRI